MAFDTDNQRLSAAAGLFEIPLADMLAAPPAIIARVYPYSYPEPSADAVAYIEALPNALCVRVEHAPASGQTGGGFVEVWCNGRWHAATPLYPVFGFDQVEGRVLGLAPNRSYPLRITYRVYDVSAVSTWVVTHNGLEDGGFTVADETVFEETGTTSVDEPTYQYPRILIYLDGNDGDDGNDGSTPALAVKTWSQVGTLVNNQGGRDIYYIGKADFYGQRLENISGSADNWNSFQPYDADSELIGYVTVTDDWEHVEESIYKVTLAGKTVGRVQYYDATRGEWRLLQGCRAYDGADQDPYTDTLATMALATGPKRYGDVEDLTYDSSTGNFTITARDHRLAVGQWVFVWGVKGDPQQTWAAALERLHQVLSVTDDTFTINKDDDTVSNANADGIYTSGGKWESQKFAGFYYKVSTEELFVRLPDFSAPQPNQVRAGYRDNLGDIGRAAPSASGPQYVWFDLRGGLAGAYASGSTDSDISYCNSSSNFGALGMFTLRNCIVTGAFSGSGILGPSIASTAAVWQDVLFDGITFTNRGPYDYVIGRRRSDAVRMWQTVDDDVHFDAAFWVYRHDFTFTPPAIHCRRAERLAIRNATSIGCRAILQITGTGGTAEDARYIDVYDSATEDQYPAFYLDDNYAISVAIYHNRVLRSNSALFAAPAIGGPIWFVGNLVDETYLKMIKQGDGTDTRGHAFVVMANNSLLDHRENVLEDISVISWHGRHSGAIAVNNVYSYVAATNRPIVFLNPTAGTVAAGRINYHENNRYFVPNLGRPAAVATSHANTIGTNSVGTYADTAARGGTTHTVASASSGGQQKIDTRYTFNVGAGNTAKQVVWKGRVSTSAPSGTQSMVWNNDTSDWDVLYNEFPRSSLVEKGHKLEPAHTDGDGDVVIRFRGEGGSSWNVYVDYIEVNAGLFAWSDTYYADFAAMHAALSADTAQFVDQTVSNDEVVDFATGLACDAIAADGVYAPGITNIASRGAGALAYDPLGYFSAFTYDDTEGLDFTGRGRSFADFEAQGELADFTAASLEGDFTAIGTLPDFRGDGQFPDFTAREE